MKVIGIITKIKAQKNNKRCSIFVDNEFLLGIDAELVYKFNLSKGQELTEEMLEHLIQHEDFIKAKNAAFNLLSYRQRSYQELRNRLSQKGFDRIIIDQVIRVLDRLDYLDDREFSTAWIKDRINKGYGPWRIRKQLQDKGVNSEIINEKINQEYNAKLEYELALELAEKKRNRYRDLKDKKTRYKLSQVLKRKGFSFEVINLVLDDLLKED